MPITNPKPVVSPAIPASTYNLLWVNMTVQGLGNTGVRAMVNLTPYYLDTNGNPVYNTSARITIAVADLLTAAGTDPALAAALNGIFTIVEGWLTTLPPYAKIMGN